MNVPIFHHRMNRFHIVTGKPCRFLKREHIDFSSALFAPGPNESFISSNDEGFAGFNKNFRPGFCHWFPFSQSCCTDLSKMFNILNEENQSAVVAVLLSLTNRKL
ncbi:MAG TPA: hypothetical protein VK308_01995 [Pyrinomonadaceae bacterium]|nr:hypothetical protein [Pyrinomonadaceae bacterium]